MTTRHQASLPSFKGTTVLRRSAIACLAIVMALSSIDDAQALDLAGTADEQAALSLADQGKYIKARTTAERILKADPSSFIARFVLADVFHMEEANHPRALFLLRAIKAELLAGGAPTSEQGQIWHKKILMKENWVLGEMDDKIGQLAVLDQYDAQYRPKLERLRIWPLMKLNRFDEAMAIGTRLAKSDNVNERISAYNGLMALEDERLDRKASYKWGKEGIENTQRQSCILFHNTAQGAMTMFKFEECESLARKALKASRDDCPNPSYEHLAVLYLLEGKFQPALSAFKKLVSYPIDRRYRQQFVMNNRAVLVEVLYALGQFEEAYTFAKEVFAAPDRTGMTSVSREEIKFAHGLAYWIAMEMRIETLREKASVRGAFSSLSQEVEIRSLRLSQWEVERILLHLGAHDDVLVTSLRPYLRGVKPWYAGHLIDALGGGLIGAAVDEAEAYDADVLSLGAQGYFTAFRAEISWRDGDWDEAISRGKRALEELPKETKLLRARTKALVADALIQRADSGADLDQASSLYREVLHVYPSAFRHLGIELPVTIRHDGHAFSKLVAEALADSRRLSSDYDIGFVVDVSVRDADASLCLATKDGFQFQCSDTELDEAGDDDVEAAADAFHNAAFSPQVELTQGDINSLDGSTVRVNADRLLEGLIDKPKTGKDDEGAR